MGRDKGQQRVKGNYKPASSGRSAELAATAGPVTFGSMSAPTAAFVPLTPEPDDTGLNSQIALVLRKLGKKDATTKIKALGELADACKSDETVPSAILQYWPKLYVRVAVDESKKVRELGHGLLETIATSVGRNLAPYTKALIPTLFLSQSDTFAPAASAARAAFFSIFPTEEKQKQAVNFCLVEFSSALLERLNGGTELNKITFLDGLNKLLRLGIGPDLYETLDLVLKQGSFWAMGTDEYALVRKTFYDILSTVAEIAGNRIPKSKLATALRHGFESERLELQSLWNCFLTLAINGVFEEKAIAEKQILQCAKNAFYGHATQLGPLVLPLVAKLGVPVQLFEALEEGFLIEKSLVERQAIIRTYAELLSYFYKENETVPTTVFPLVTTHLSVMGEFGRTISSLVKKPSFYESLSKFCLGTDSIIHNPQFGTFITSFFQNKRQVKFSDAEKPNAYDSLTQPEFLRTISLGILRVKNFSSFSTLQRFFSGSKFLPDLINPQEISASFTFPQEADNVVRLHVTLELIKAFPESDQALTLLSSTFSMFQCNTEDLEVFIREIEPYDDIKELRAWLKSGVVSDDILLKSNVLTKYVLRRKEIFGEELAQQKLTLLEGTPLDHLDLARDFVSDSTSCKAMDLGPFFISIWNAFLDDKSGDDGRLEEIADEIVNNKVVAKEVLLKRIKVKAGEGELLEELSRLVTIGRKVVGDEKMDVDEVSVDIDPDLLAFRGFGIGSLKSCDLEPPKEFSISKPLRQLIFNTEVSLGDDISQRESSDLEALAIQLLYAATLVDIGKDTGRRQWPLALEQSETEIFDRVSSLLGTVVEHLGKTEHWPLFVKRAYQKTGDCVWNSKFPVMKLLEITDRLELPVLKYFSDNDLSAISTLDVRTVMELVQRLKLNSNPPFSKVVQLMTTTRNENPEQFYFEQEFNTLKPEEMDVLLGILDIVIELIGKGDLNFASVASCWVSAWLKQATDKYDSDRRSYLWKSKLSQAVVSLSKFASEETPFKVEFNEFHALNIFPYVYRHFLELAASDSFWAVEGAENVAEAVSRIPTPILNSLIEEPSKAFGLFLPLMTSRKQLWFKIAAYALLCKVTLTKEILPREFEAFSKRSRKAGLNSDESIVTYVLLWDALLRAQPNSFELANYVKEDHLLPQALRVLFFDLLDPSISIPNLKAYFDTLPTIGCRSISNVTHLGTWLLQDLLRTLPYTVRWWWASLSNKGNKAHVEKLTTKFLSAKLATEELNKVKWDEAGDNVSVNSHPGCNELIARYKIEESSVTLKITLPLNHPLGPVTVVVSDKKLHARISQLLNTRSHSLSAGLRLWKESLDTVYKDADECAICFFILQHQTKQLPKMGCKTCKKKFHATCLYKWFSTSNKSECPLCRNLW